MENNNNSNIQPVTGMFGAKSNGNAANHTVSSNLSAAGKAVMDHSGIKSIKTDREYTQNASFGPNIKPSSSNMVP